MHFVLLISPGAVSESSRFKLCDPKNKFQQKRHHQNQVLRRETIPETKVLMEQTAHWFAPLHP